MGFIHEKNPWLFDWTNLIVTHSKKHNCRGVTINKTRIGIMTSGKYLREWTILIMQRISEQLRRLFLRFMRHSWWIYETGVAISIAVPLCLKYLCEEPPLSPTQHALAPVMTDLGFGIEPTCRYLEGHFKYLSVRTRQGVSPWFMTNSDFYEILMWSFMDHQNLIGDYDFFVQPLLPW